MILGSSLSEFAGRESNKPDDAIWLLSIVELERTIHGGSPNHSKSDFDIFGNVCDTSHCWWIDVGNTRVLGILSQSKFVLAARIRLNALPPIASIVASVEFNNLNFVMWFVFRFELQNYVNSKPFSELAHCLILCHELDFRCFCIILEAFFSTMFVGV